MEDTLKGWITAVGHIRTFFARRQRALFFAITIRNHILAPKPASLVMEMMMMVVMSVVVVGVVGVVVV